MASRQTVRARERQGANSLDLTLPAKVVKKYGVDAGDVFALEVKEVDGRLVVCYTRVYGGE